MNPLTQAQLNAFAQTGTCPNCQKHALVQLGITAQLDKVDIGYECIGCRTRFLATYTVSNAIMTAANP